MVTSPNILNNAILNLIALLPRKVGQKSETKMADMIKILDEILLSNLNRRVSIQIGTSSFYFL